MRAAVAVVFILAALASVALAGQVTVQVKFDDVHKSCNTAQYRGRTDKQLILRRGCTFQLSATFADAADAGSKEPTVRVSSLAGGSAQDTAWPAKLVSGKAGEKSFVFEVTVGSAFSGNQLVGKHKIEVVTAGGKSFPLDADVMVIFNPYDKASPFYVADDAKRKDIVDTEAGAIWVGGSANPTWSPWAYDQFGPDVWQTVFDIVSGMPANSIKTPEQAVRTFAGVIASKVLTGKWGPTGYDDADKKPWEWASSSDIYRVVRTQKRPAKYGQCMIFSAVTASFMRAMGIPAVSTTGYDFVQDQGNDRIINVYWKPDGKGGYLWNSDKNTNGDKVWNFHAWTVVYMSRPDLGIAEVKPNIADGTWHAGPVSIQRFKEKQLNANFDTKAYDPSINSDVVNVYEVPGKAPFRWEKPFIPANRIVTKKDDSSVGCKNTFDPVRNRYTGICMTETVTDYKAVVPKPNARPTIPSSSSFLLSVRERLTSRFTSRRGADDDADDEVQFVSLDLERSVGTYTVKSRLPLGARLGNPFSASFDISPAVDKIRISVWATTYDGRPVFELAAGEGAGSTKHYRLEVPTDKWNVPEADRKKIASVTHVRATYFAYKGDQLVAVDSRTMPLRMPRLNMLCGDVSKVTVKRTVKCAINFFNPLPFPIEASIDALISGNDRDPSSVSKETITIKGKTAGAKPSDYRGFFKSVTVPTTTAGKATLIAVLRTPYLNTVFGVQDVEIVGETAVAATSSQLAGKKKKTTEML